MSKRKNTLNDLEEFLKLQASTLVPPQPVETAKPVEKPKPAELVKEEPIITQRPVQRPSSFEPAKAVDLLEELKRLATGNKNSFYDHIIEAAEAMHGSNDILLINTALYLKHGDNWKSGIEEYWRKRKTIGN